MGVSKVDLGDRTLIDLTNDNVSPDTLLSDTFAHTANGERIRGNIVRRDKGGGTISAKDDSVPIPAGYYTGGGSVMIDSNAVKDLVAGNIKKGATILGVGGSLVVPSGTLSITSNGTFDVSSYSSVSVDVSLTYQMFQITQSSTGNLVVGGIPFYPLGYVAMPGIDSSTGSRLVTHSSGDMVASANAGGRRGITRTSTNNQTQYIYPEWAITGSGTNYTITVTGTFRSGRGYTVQVWGIV